MERIIALGLKRSQPWFGMGLGQKTHVCERANGYQNGMLDEESIWLFYKMKMIGNTPLRRLQSYHMFHYKLLY
jgi:hypothetical protein